MPRPAHARRGRGGAGRGFDFYFDERGAPRTHSDMDMVSESKSNYRLCLLLALNNLYCIMTLETTARVSNLVKQLVEPRKLNIVMKTKITVLAVIVTVLLTSQTKIFGQSAPANMALVPAGSFQMGDSFAEFDYRELPVHTTYVSGFYMDTTSVSKIKWDEVYSWAITHGYTFDNTGSAKYGSHPIVVINWYDIVKWCNARSEKENRIPAYYTDGTQTTPYRTGQVDVQSDSVKWSAGYRLPTEAEREKATRGGVSGRRFPWGNTITHNQANYNGDGAYSYDTGGNYSGYHPSYSSVPDNAFPYTAPALSFAPNGYGLYNMSGNVWEWCWDWFGSAYYYSSPSSNPLGLESGVYRVMKGGSWASNAQPCRNSYRNASLPGSRYTDVGFRTVLSLASPDPIQVITAETIRPIYGVGPAREVGKDSLIVVTHGWQPAWKPVDVAWVDTMVNAISNNVIVDRGLNNWQVHPCKWVEGARPSSIFIMGGAEIALDNAKKEGVSLGRDIAGQRFNHVHLIGHSAGAGLIQSASETIKALDPSIIVHLTFLDAFVGFDYAGKINYGKGADWADNYISSDLDTGLGLYQLTESLLDNAYNVNVTWLDPNKKRVPINSSVPAPGLSETHYQTVASHGWPYQFYTNTVPPNSMMPESEGFGFPLSKEGGNWDFALANYKVGKDMLKTLGEEDSSSLPPQFGNSNQMESVLDLSELPEGALIISSSDHVIIHGLDFTLLTASPAWMSGQIPITNRVNLVSFEAQFTSANGSEGLLTVYWETNIIGTVDERVTSTGIHQYTFPIPEIATNGTRALGFRLDPFTATQSSVVITSVALGFSGVREPFSLSLTNGAGLQLSGPSGFNYRAQVSTNLINWSDIAILVNTNGTVRFTDPESTNATRRFYRAVTP